MKLKHPTHIRTQFFYAAIISVTAINYLYAAANRAAPTEHKGLGVKQIGLVDEASLKAQIGLEGYVLQLREIVIAPGGEIAKHSHATRPGLVWTLDGSVVEGRIGGETAFPASEKIGLIEDIDTEHWFWNDTAEPVTLAVCDIVPSE